MRESHKIVARRVGQRLKELRGSQTQQEYAKGLGLSQAQYNRYETGKRLAPDSLLEAAAAGCGLSPEQLIWGRGPVSLDRAAEPGFAQAVARLVGLLDTRSREDIYLYLRQKVGRSRQKVVIQAAEAMERAFRRAG